MIRNNDDISIFYILYHAVMLGSSIIGPGSIYLMFVAAEEIIFNFHQDLIVFAVNLVPFVAFILVLIYGTQDQQITFAKASSKPKSLTFLDLTD